MDKKICIYGICKNERKFVERWLNSVAPEADFIVVLDTGSTDGTFEFLRDDPRVTRVEQKVITPWRFDSARNESMKLIPNEADICVIADFDHIFRPGWSYELRRLFDLGYQEVYGDIIDYDDNNEEIKRFLSKNVHPNDPRWWWERPIHEGIIFHGDENELQTITSDNFVIEHHPDTTKSRGSYLGLLETEYKENRKDPMCAIYYGCELSFHGRYDESLKVFLDAEKECDFSNHPEVGYILHMNIANHLMIHKHDYQEALKHMPLAESYGVVTRWLYMRWADIYFALEDYSKSAEYMLKALDVKYNIKGWVEEQDYFGNRIYDQLSLVYGQLKDYKKAVAYCSLAVDMEPDNERLQNNMNWFMEEMIKDE